MTKTVSLPFPLKVRWHMFTHPDHQLHVNRNVTVPSFDSYSRGWLFSCDTCGWRAGY